MEINQMFMPWFWVREESYVLKNSNSTHNVMS